MTTLVLLKILYVLIDKIKTQKNPRNSNLWSFPAPPILNLQEFPSPSDRDGKKSLYFLN